MDTEKKTVDEQRAFFTASQEQDKLGIETRIQELKAFSDRELDTLQARSKELQDLSVKSIATREETEDRHKDVDRLNHELQEARTDLFRLNVIRQDLTDRLVRLELENQELVSRKAQLDGKAAGSYEDPAGK
jgi:hypothetical protein